ncbi:uncharacterized protein SOCEGT47_016980 [Sorangium cellulosum]|uniref:Orc1-like AAA ATPase domain-containing protein n=1 Tax=Sorangium cellulosum TaxID=56 RepID=A0A4P2PWR2_SORCE|nr:hypothetical protein [Sorangium cellulosum]AUX21219.1 uncharacterized protein SOCEGT47_016980 [Sorangium cellulosum]
METGKLEAPEDFKSWMLGEVSDAQGIVDKLQRAGLALRRVEPAERAGSTRTWLLFWEPPRHLCESFDLAPELLVVLTPWKEAQARDVSLAEEALRRDHRLDRGVVLVVACDPAAERRLARPVQRTGRLYIFVSADAVLTVQDPQRWLRDLLQERIGSGDLFAAGRPVFGWDFVGRQQELRSIRGRLLDGRPVGLYGLRKAGKTSVLIALRDQLISDATADDASIVAIPVHVDLLSLSFAEMKRSGFMRYLLRSMHDALERLDLSPTNLGLPASFADRRRLGELDGEDLERLVPEALECLIDWARSTPSRPAIFLLIDEYERILGASRFPVTDGLDILDYLRGLIQRYPKTFNILIAGLDRQKASVSRYGQRQNPLFNFVVDHPLAGLEREEMNELIRKIGRRLSLHFKSDALDVIWRETGGHPYLAREFGRVIDRQIPSQKRNSMRIDRAIALEHLEEFRRETVPTMQEILDAVRTIDPQAPEVLAYIVQYPEDAEESLNSFLKPESVHTLRRYGILNETGAPEQLRIGSFGAWLLQNQPIGMPTAANA